MNLDAFAFCHMKYTLLSLAKCDGKKEKKLLSGGCADVLSVNESLVPISFIMQSEGVIYK